MSNCPNCGFHDYSIGAPCTPCHYYELPKYWDLNFRALYIERDNWAVAYNGTIVESEFASQRDAEELSEKWEEEMHKEWGILKYTKKNGTL